MSEDKVYEVRESRIRTLAEKCPDYKTAMQILFPDAFESQERDVTKEIQFEYVGNDFFVIKHNGQEVARQWCLTKVEDRQLIITFALSSEKYHFFVTADRNWRLIKER